MKQMKFKYFHADAEFPRNFARRCASSYIQFFCKLVRAFEAESESSVCNLMSQKLRALFMLEIVCDALEI